MTQRKVSKRRDGIDAATKRLRVVDPKGEAAWTKLNTTLHTLADNSNGTIDELAAVRKRLEAVEGRPEPPFPFPAAS